ncbi:outer membrane protein assembly factor BamE [Porticoccaceae bacterium LTM1]|nr:outer membrane protein assembly factor BamE [Porticoccaceae bacterium LTM1]
MRRTLQLTIIASLLLTLSACQNFGFPGVYKIPIQQGNIITQEMVDQLEPGRTKAQVQFILGTPLIADSFHSDRWDYFYSMDDRQSPEKRERLTVFFEDGKLTHIVGDFVPSSAKQVGTE